MKPRLALALTGAVPLLLAAAIARPGRSQAAVAQPGPLAALAFMSGCWRGPFGEAAGGTLEESWTAADTDVMLAAARYNQGGRTVGFEFSRIHADSAGVTLTPYPDGGRSVPFTLVRPGEEGRAVFQNLAHDFPQRIVYRRAGDAMVVRIEDDARGEEWEMRRVECGRE